MPKLTEIELKTLREQYQEHEVTQARTAVKKAQLDMTVVDMFQRHSMLQGRYGLCLDCGAFFPRHSSCACVGAGADG